MSLQTGLQYVPKKSLLTRQIIQKPCKTHSFWPEAPLWNVLFLLVFNFCLKNLFICNLCFYISRSSIFRDRGLFFPLFLVCFSGVFFEASFWAIQWKIEFDLQNTALSGPHVFLMYTKKKCLGKKKEHRRTRNLSSCSWQFLEIVTIPTR